MLAARAEFVIFRIGEHPYSLFKSNMLESLGC
jgi:hypothetical protein